MGYPNIHKRDIPLRPIVSNRGSLNYEVGKELSRILRLLVGKSPHYIKNTGDFVQQVKGITLKPGECITSYDVSALFTPVPIELAINIIRTKVRTGPRTLHKSNNESRADHQSTRVLFEDHLVPGQVL